MAEPMRNADAERACLAAAMLDADARAVVASLLRVEDFGSSQHQWIWRAILAVDAEARPVDAITVASWLRSNETLQAVGGSPYLAKILDEVPAVANVAAYAQLVGDMARARRMVELCQTVVAEIGTASDVGEYLLKTEARVCEITSAAVRDDTSGLLGDCVKNALQRSLDVQLGKEIAAWPTGYAELDDLFDGWSPGQVYVVAGRTGMGKTVFACQCVEELCAATPGVGAILFSLEMKQLEVAQRTLSRQTGYPLRTIKKGQLEAGEWSGAQRASERVANLPIWVEDKRRLTVQQIRSLARRHYSTLRNRFGADLRLGAVVIDYVQLLSANEAKRSRVEEYEEISREIKLLSGDLDCAIIAVAQLNRSVEDRVKGDRRPKVSDLRGSGAWEQDADKILFIHREDYYETDAAKWDKEAEIILAKGRDSGTGRTVMGWDGQSVRVVSLKAPPPQADLWAGEDE